MESSILVYIFLTVTVVILGLFVKNEEYLSAATCTGNRAGAVQPAEGMLPLCSRQKARNRVAAFAVYCLLAGVSACRIAVGNDYWVYTANFSLISQERHVSSEIGFNSVVRFFQMLFPEGKVQYISIFAFFSLTTVFFFVKALNNQGSSFAFSLFLLLTGGYYFNSLNSVRYYFALALALFSMKYVLRKEFGKFFLCVMVGMLIHKSVLLTVPVYLLARYLAGIRIKRWFWILGGIFLASLVFCQDLYRELIFYFYPFYRDSAFDNGRISWINVLKCVCVLLLCLICFRRSLSDPEKHMADRFYFFLNLFGLIVYCCGSFIPETSRVGYYMIISQVFLLPDLLAEMKRGWLRSFCQAGVLTAFTAYFAFQLKGMYATDIRLLPYLNWIFH